MESIKFMKRNYKLFLLALLLSVASCSFTTKNKKIDPGDDDDRQEVLSELVSFVLNNYHYSPQDIDDEFSESVYKSFLKHLDSQKRYFLKSDIDELSEYKDKIDNELKDNETEFFNLAHEKLEKRMEEMEPVYKDILDEPFDFDKDEEEIKTDYEELDYAESKDDLKERWRRQLKFNTLTNYYDLKKQEKSKKEDDEDYDQKSDKELEEEARETTEHSLEQFYDINEDIDKDEWFSIYLNTIANEFDPHTNYMAPQDKERFDVAMSGSLEGIGARLQQDMDDIKVVELISGGPAWKDGQLEVGDVIKKVKQEDEDKAKSISGMSINDAVKLIKGKKGTKVTLTIKKVDGSLEEIKLTRDVVEIEETYAKSAMTKKDDEKLGVIKLPSFYFDTEDYKKRNAASDVKKEVDSLKAQGMEGLVLDLRDNGGGSLSTAIDIAGLFVKKGPIVQVSDGDDKKEALKNESPSVDWDGPLVILVNELSASASEILSAAMQDYGRGVIIGSKQTYGKGTVQKLLDLNRFMRNDKLGDMGALKVTTQKFYRINGGSTQLKGVHSDIQIPDRYTYIDVGERDMHNPLPWDELEKSNYTKWDGYKNFDEVVENSKERIAHNDQIKKIDKSAKWIKKKRDENVFPLKYSAYKDKVKKEEDYAKEFKSVTDYETDLTFKSLPAEQQRFETDTTLAEKRKRWHKNLSQDIYLDEALNVAEDLKLNDEQKAKVAETKE